MSLHIAKAISALHHTLLLILGMGFVSLVQAQVVGEDLVLRNMTISAGEDETYEATKSITTAGNDAAGTATTFVVKAGGSATLKARVRIELKAGTRIESGASFRAFIDPNAGNFSPTLTILEPDGVDDTADESYSISWSDEALVNDASIFLYYDPDHEGEDGTPINLLPISEDDEADAYTWDTSEVIEGDYYVYGVIDDSVNPAVVDYSEGPVRIDHNDAPVAEDDFATTDEDTPVIVDVLANDTDVDGDALSFATFDTVTSNGGVTPFLGGTVLRYTPNANFNGSDSFTYTVSDGEGGTATGRVTVTVNAVNDAPVANDDFAATEEDTPVLTTVLANDTDPEDDSLSVASFSQGSNGSVERGGFGRLLYRPDDDFNGSDSFTYEVSDGNGGTDTATVGVTVTAVNDPPVGSNDSVTTDEDTPVIIDVLANDTDVEDEDDTLKFRSLTSPSHGSVTSWNDGEELRYTPEENFNGSDSFTYDVEDSDGSRTTATVNITVTAVDDPPIAVDDFATMNEDSNWFWIDVLDNDKQADPDGNGGDLRVTSFSQGVKGEVNQPSANSSALRYRPDPNTNGLDSFTYVVRDNAGTGEAATGTVTVTVNVVDDPPVAVDDFATTEERKRVWINVMRNDEEADPDGDDLSVVSFTQGSNGSVDQSSSNVLSYRANNNFYGVDSFSYEVSDGNGGTDTGTVTVTVLKKAQVAAPWKFLSSKTGKEVTVYFGQHGDIPVACDYDGDGITDLAVWRTYQNPSYGNGPVSQWIIRQSSNDETVFESFGDLNDRFPYDVPVQADYDGDGHCDMAYLDTTGSGVTGNFWHIKESESGNTVTRRWNPFHPDVDSHEDYTTIDDFRIDANGNWRGTSGFPAPADYDGDGKADLGVFWPFLAAWTYQSSRDGVDVQLTYGRPGEKISGYQFRTFWDIYDLPVPADYNRDGLAEPATWRPANTEWSIQGSPAVTIGKGLEVPVTGDFDGDGKADPAVFVQTPDITMEHITDDITDETVTEWEGRHGEQAIIEDDGTYRMTMCGSSPTGGLADDLYYSESSSPTGGFSYPQRIILGSCEHSLLKVPSSINPNVFENQCGAGSSVYLLYAAGESYDLSEATFNGPQNHIEYIWPPTLNEFQDPDVWPTGIGNKEAWGWEGAKTILYSACGDLGNPRSWVRRGPVFQIPELDPDTTSFHDPIGTQQPNAIYQDGTIYVSVYYDAEVGGEDRVQTHLAVSTDGINFTDTGVSGVARSNRNHGLGQSSSIIGHTWHSAIEHWRGPQEGGHSIDASSHLHFSKDLGNLKAPRTAAQYRHVDHLLSVPKSKTCSYAPGILESPHGIVEGNSTYVYSLEWDHNYYCTCRRGKPTGHNVPGTQEPDMCNHGLRDNGTWSLGTGEVGVAKVDFNFTETACIGSRYSPCTDGSCTGPQRVRACTGENIWSEWMNEILFEDDFSDGNIDEWQIVDEGTNGGPSNWAVVDGKLLQSSNIFSNDPRRGTFAFYDNPDAFNWSDYQADVTLRSGDDDGIGLMFYYQDANNYYKVDIDQQRNFTRLYKVVNGVETILASASRAYEINVAIPLRVETNNNQISVSLGGVDLFGVVSDAGLTSGSIALYCWGNTDCAFDGIIVGK